MTMVNNKWITLFESDSKVLDLAREIVSKGYVLLPDFFEQNTFDTLLEYSYSMGFDDSPKITWTVDTPAMKIVRSNEVARIFDAIHKARCILDGRNYLPLEKNKFAISLPIRNDSSHHLTGENPFHYDDSYVICCSSLAITS